MPFLPTDIPEVMVFEPRVFTDDRGFFFESYNQQLFVEAVGSSFQFVQDNHSRSARGVLRGLHYQLPPYAQGKLVRAVIGEIFDVAVDIRKGSPTFGRWVSEVLSESNKRQLWIPPGFAHGFYALSKSADVIYKTTDFYMPSAERCIIWNDIDLQIDWPTTGSAEVSQRDAKGVALAVADIFT